MDAQQAIALLIGQQAIQIAALQEQLAAAKAQIEAMKKAAKT